MIDVQKSKEVALSFCPFMIEGRHVDACCYSFMDQASSALVAFAQEEVRKAVQERDRLLRSAHKWLPDNLATLDGGPTTKEKIASLLGLEVK